MKGFFTKLKHGYIWERIFVERLTEPLHLNFIALFILIFGSTRKKMQFDLLMRQNHAYGLYQAADNAKRMGKDRTTVIEFGVANGAGLINLQKLARKITKDTGVNFDIYGFDTGTGMPPPQSYKDHPELYQSGDYPMNRSLLEAHLTKNAKLVIGNISETLSSFCETDYTDSPLGFISIDVDYYSSTLDVLEVLTMNEINYLPQVIVYVDDLEIFSHNSWCGELAAIHEFNDTHDLRKIEKHAFLRGTRIFKNTRWIDHIFQAHILDHPVRNNLQSTRNSDILVNPHISN